MWQTLGESRLTYTAQLRKMPAWSRNVGNNWQVKLLVVLAIGFPTTAYLTSGISASFLVLFRTSELYARRRWHVLHYPPRLNDTRCTVTFCKPRTTLNPVSSILFGYGWRTMQQYKFRKCALILILVIWLHKAKQRRLLCVLFPACRISRNLCIVFFETASSFQFGSGYRV